MCILSDDKQTYPSIGSSVFLILHGNYLQAKVLVCGGALSGAFIKSDKKKTFPKASRTCRRLKVTNLNLVWSMETMSMPHVIPDMLLLATSDVILINGANHGTAGWNNTKHSNFNQVLYSPDEEPT